MTPLLTPLVVWAFSSNVLSKELEKSSLPLIVALTSEEVLKHENDADYIVKLLNNDQTSSLPGDSEHKPQADKNKLTAPEMMKKRFDEIREKQLNEFKNINLEQVAKFKSIIKATKQSYKKTLERWREAENDYLRDKVDYQDNLVAFNGLKKSWKHSATSRQRSYASSEKSQKLVYHLIPGSQQVSIKSQGKRPTCSAFAGIRAIEIHLAANGHLLDLSEQYFYWASKPGCRTQRCANGGSWASQGYTYSQQQNRLDIPTDSSCPYNRYTDDSNDTQIPLNGKCLNQGAVQIRAFETYNDFGSVREALLKNHPIVTAVTLSPEFYDVKAFLSNRVQSQAKIDKHAKGHAINIVGFMQLPESQKFGEGDYCYFVANSWGEGWGSGGHSCISEKWLVRHRMQFPFLAPTKISHRLSKS